MIGFWKNVLIFFTREHSYFHESLGKIFVGQIVKQRLILNWKMSLLYFFKLLKFCIIPDIIFGVVLVRSQHQTNSARRKIVQFAPHTRLQIKAHVRTVQRHRFFILAIIYRYIKAATGSNDYLFYTSMRMCASRLAARYIIQVIHTLHRKGNIHTVCNRRKIACRVAYFTEVKHRTIKYCIRIVLWKRAVWMLQSFWYNHVRCIHNRKR